MGGGDGGTGRPAQSRLFTVAWTDVFDATTPEGPIKHVPNQPAAKRTAVELRRAPTLVDKASETLGSLAVSKSDAEAFLTGPVARALAVRDIPLEYTQSPRPDVLLPAVEAQRYSTLNQELANLVASSMDGRIAHTVLPAYIEVLKQLSPDEVELLRRAPILGRYSAVADLVHVYPNGQVVIAYRHILPEFMSKGCAVRSNISQYVDNLMRLALLERPYGEEAAEENYRGLLKYKFVDELRRSAPSRAKVALDRSVIGVTDFGDQFRRACLY